MAWEWSHTAEAYEYAESRLKKMRIGLIREIWAEWQTYQKAQKEAWEEARKEAEEEDWPEPTHVNESDDFDQDYYKEMLKEAKTDYYSKESLCIDIWHWAKELATCTNGGWEAWMCPYGCGCHMVPFSKESR